MANMEYTTEDFGPVMDAETKPEKVGWYVATPFNRSKLYMLHTFPKQINWIDFWYWDGKYWKATEKGLPAHVQDRRWFGLKSKP